MPAISPKPTTLLLCHPIYAHIKTRGFQILIERMRKQCVPGSFLLPRKEPGNEASKYPYSICVHFISSCSLCSTLGSAFSIIAVRMPTGHVNLMAKARSDRNLMVKLLIFAPLCMERMKSLMVGTWSCSSRRWQSPNHDQM